MSRQDDRTQLSEFKAQARRLSAALAEDGVTLSHSRALELVARQQGVRDWNTLSARVKNTPAPSNTAAQALALGQRVRGAYLGHAFTGRLRGLATVGAAGHRRVTVEFDAPIDVVASEAFSSHRRRVTCVVDAQNRSPEKTSNGAPILLLAD